MTLFAATEAPAGRRAGGQVGWGGVGGEDSAALKRKELTLTLMPSNGSVLLLLSALKETQSAAAGL